MTFVNFMTTGEGMEEMSVEPVSVQRCLSREHTSHRWALLRLFCGTWWRPARPCAQPHTDTSRGGVVVLITRSKARAVQRSRAVGHPGRSRALWQKPKQPRGTRQHEVTMLSMAVLAVG